LSFDQRNDEIGFRPARTQDATYFWSAGRGWGEMEFRGRSALLTVKGGELVVSRLRLPTLPGRLVIDGKFAQRDGDVVLLGARRVLSAGGQLRVGADESGAS
jgi:non-lysosomal glucosylceramidase